MSEPLTWERRDITGYEECTDWGWTLISGDWDCPVLLDVGVLEFGTDADARRVAQGLVGLLDENERGWHLFKWGDPVELVDPTLPTRSGATPSRLGKFVAESPNNPESAIVIIDGRLMSVGPLDIRAKEGP